MSRGALLRPSTLHLPLCIPAGAQYLEVVSDSRLTIEESISLSARVWPSHTSGPRAHHRLRLCPAAWFWQEALGNHLLGPVENCRSPCSVE